MLPSYSQAIYQYQQSQQCHIASPDSDQHYLLPPAIEIIESVDTKTPHTLAKASSSDNDLYWTGWGGTHLPEVYYYDEDFGSYGPFRLILHKPHKGLTEPFRLLVFPVDETMPETDQFYALLAEELAALPPLLRADQVVNPH